jgi:hypothetical protein
LRGPVSLAFLAFLASVDSLLSVNLPVFITSFPRNELAGRLLSIILTLRASAVTLAGHITTPLDMAFNLSLGSLTLLLVLLQTVSAQFCSFWNNGCIDSLAQTAIRFDLNPLFPDPVTLYYGFDVSSSGKGEGPMTKTAFWLGYQNNNINLNAVDSNRTSELGLRIGNLTGTPSGANNGCDGIWGEDCSRDLKSALQNGIYRLAVSGEYYSKPLEAVLSKMLAKPPPLPSCPPPTLDVAAIPVQGLSIITSSRSYVLTLLDFAKERVPDKNVTIMPPGSGAWPWQVWYLDDMSARNQASQVAVGIISRAPSYNSIPPDGPDDIMVELVCVQAPSSGASKSSQD